jgi:hypothetical protein
MYDREVPVRTPAPPRLSQATWPAVAIAATLVLGGGCGTEESPRVSLPVAIDASEAGKAVASDLGYSVTLTRARAALRDLRFTVGGESHASFLHRLQGWLVPAAHAHPGHSAGGEVVGELPGPLLVDWLKEGAAMGVALMIAGRYEGANFGFRSAGAAELPPGDPLVGHTFAFEGTASKDGRTLSFSALLDVDSTAELVGAPFDHEVVAGATGRLGLRLLPRDPTAPTDTIWNGIDFFALPGAAEGAATISAAQEAHNRLVRALRIHDHYDVTHR